MAYQITRHAQERYSERIMGKDDETDINLFISNHIAKINEDIEKMITYGEKLYEGKPLTDFNKQPVAIYLKDAWVVVVDEKSKKVVTLFSIDLGVGKEFNQQYIDMLRKKLDEEKKKFGEYQKASAEKLQEYEYIISSNEATLQEYRKLCKSLEEQNKMYKGLIQEENTNLTIAETGVREVVGTLIGKKIF